ncbi:hypothetical protein LZU09_05865 [Staphylococcus epidermidis]|nr:hypothetical protein [Staphylococcus epidermidis]
MSCSLKSLAKILLETSVHIPTNDISRYVHDIVETILETEFRHHRGLI